MCLSNNSCNNTVAKGKKHFSTVREVVECGIESKLSLKLSRGEGKYYSGCRKVYFTRKFENSCSSNQYIFMISFTYVNASGVMTEKKNRIIYLYKSEVHMK